MGESSRSRKKERTQNKLLMACTMIRRMMAHHLHHPRYPDVRSVEPQTYPSLLTAASSNSESRTTTTSSSTTFLSSGGRTEQQSSNIFFQQNNGQQHGSSSNNNENAMLHNHTHTILVAILIALIILFLCILSYLVVPLLLKFLLARWAASERRVQRRYETIEGWLISKKVRSHCKTCEQVQKQCKNTTNAAAAATKTPPKATCDEDHCGSTNQEKVKLSPSYDTAETEPMEGNDYYFGDDNHHHRNHECTICYEDFAAGDIVSWSPQPQSRCCRHVFHHECIKEWLLHHDTCPCCRVIFLPVDQPPALDDDGTAEKKHNHFWWSTREKSQHMRTWIDQRLHRLKTTYYCLQEGLVILDQPMVPRQPQSDSTADEDLHDKKLRRFVGSGVKTAVLAQLRQSRSSASPTASKNSAANDSENTDQNSGRSPSPRETTAAAPTPLLVSNRRSPLATSSTNSAAVPLPLFFTTTILSPAPAPPPSSTNSSCSSVVDLELCMQQLRALSNDGDSKDGSSSEEENEGIFLDTASSPSINSARSNNSCTTPTPQPLHHSHAVVNIEMSLMRQQQESSAAAAAVDPSIIEDNDPRRVKEDWESASF